MVVVVVVEGFDVLLLLVVLVMGSPEQVIGGMKFQPGCVAQQPAEMVWQSPPPPGLKPIHCVVGP